MYYVYVLQSQAKPEKLYFGYTEDLKTRIARHNTGTNKSTKPYAPWKLIFYEAYLNKYDALRREKYFKSTKGRTTIKSMLCEHFAHNSG